MNIYQSGFQAVSDLHNNGFTQDFQLFGNDLLWVQEKIFIREHEFSIVEYHEIIELRRGVDEIIVFGIICPYHQAKGILVNHYSLYTAYTPPVILRKLNELSISADRNDKEDYQYEKK